MKEIVKIHPGLELREGMLNEIDCVFKLHKAPDISIEGKIHETRKSIKRLRASLRLLKVLLSEKSYHRLDSKLGKAARVLSEMRDNTVNLRTFIELINKETHPLPPNSVEEILHQLSDRINKSYNTGKNAPNLRFRTTDFILKQVQQYLLGIEYEKIDTRNLMNSIDSAFIRAFHGYSDAAYTRETEIIHTWRKHSKSLLLQMKICPVIEKDSYSELLRALDHLTDILGKDHDLANLEHTINQHITLSKQEKKQLIPIINKARVKNQKRAFKIGESIFSTEAVKLARTSFNS